jgi:hypothetical protein
VFRRSPPLPYTKDARLCADRLGNGFGSLATFGDYDNFSWKNNFRGD